MLKIKCPNCHKKISKRWLLFSKDKEIYTCNNCGIKLKWNKFNRISLFLSFICSSFTIAYTKNYWYHSISFLNIIFALFVMLLIIIGYNVILCVILPNQISIKKE